MAAQRSDVMGELRPRSTVGQLGASPRPERWYRTGFAFPSTGDARIDGGVRPGMRCLVVAPLAVSLLLGCAPTGEREAEPRTPTGPRGPALDPVIGLSVVPPVLEAWVGLPSALQLHARTRAGDVVPVVGAEWTSESPSIARVDGSTGALTIIAPGRARIVARWRDLVAWGEVVATVQCRGPALVPIGPTTLRVGERAQWAARISTCGAAPEEPVRWSSSDTLVLHLTPDGLGTGVGVGVAAVTAQLIQRGAAVSVAVVVERAP